MKNILENVQKKRGRPFKGTRYPPFALRINPIDLNKIDPLIESGDYSSRSDFILKAIEEKLTKDRA